MIKYSIGEFSKLIGRSVHSLQRWDREGVLIALRSEKNRRFYTYEQYIAVKNIGSETNNTLIAYCRVDAKMDLKDPGKILKSNKAKIKKYAKTNGLIVEKWIEDVSSVFELRSEGLDGLIQLIVIGKASKIVFIHNKILSKEVLELMEYISNLQGIEFINLP